MSDTRKRSRHSSTSGSHRTPSSRHHSSRHLSATSSSSVNRSSSSVNRAPPSSGDGSASTNDSGKYGGSNEVPPVSGGGSRPDAGQIYGGMATPAGESRFSLTDQFAATRSVIDFDFDDGASSIFDSASVFSMGTSRAPSVRAPSTRAPSIAPSSVWSSGFGEDSFLGSEGEDTIMGGYDTLVEEDEDSDEDDDEDDENNDEDDDEDGRHTPKLRAEGNAGVRDSKQRTEKLQDQLLQLQQDQLLLRSPVLQATLPGQPQPMRRTYYEVLCLARHPAPHSGEIRAAYFRLFRLLNNDHSSGGRYGIAKALQPTAAFYFAQAQAAFETLIDPARRLEYDRYLDDQEEEDNDEEEDGSSSSKCDSDSRLTAEEEARDEEEIRRLRALASRQSFQATTDMGIRYDASRVLLPEYLQHGDAQADSSALSSVDYSLTQAVRIGLPRLGRCTEAGILQLQRRLYRTQNSLNQLRVRFGANRDKIAASTQRMQPWPVFCSTPIVGVSASTYAMTSTSANWRSGRDAPLSTDRHQPLLPEALAPIRAVQLADTRSTGRVVLSYRQEFAWGPMPSHLPPTVAEVEAEVLPHLSVTTRIAQPVPVTIPRVDEAMGVPDQEPLYVEVMVHDGKGCSLVGSAPRLGLGLSRRMGEGDVFLCADSGSSGGWSPWWPFSTAADVATAVIAPGIASMVEVGYSLSADELGLHAGRPLTGPADRGLKGIDGDLDALEASSSRGHGRGTWTASAAITGQLTLAGYLRYGRTLFLTPWGHLGKKLQKGRRTDGSRRAVRVEAELCASRFSADGYLAIRGLAPIRWWGVRNGWTSGPSASSTPPKLGLEVALSAGSGSVHVSLYWSRVGQRIKLPFLLLPASGDLSVTSRLFLWAAGLPVAVVALRELVQAFLRVRQRRKRREQKEQKEQKEDEAKIETGGFDDFEEEQAIERHRAEADELTMVLSSAVDALKAIAAGGNSSNGSGDRDKDASGLIILSAKYGVALGDDSDDSDGAELRKRKRKHTSVNGSAATSTAMATRNGWSPDYEVADVTAALTALVVSAGSRGNDIVPAADADSDSDCLLIPRGERIAEVGNRDGLRLP
ncbi:heat shock protein DNAj [Grosmannia clavigera kw1407]|uniref:Heat shock protein DNAj n=1 Tax=Grosmannia clavigera (strain kw1407 / UAMH 11150) TaxID=655863 RepID=F0XT28_GROCL|nr:heat shock protein DNAj [Grosmannia clavigera kw1407]EFW99105.1 heat shock protein DNAj [Grosmannia clavigera kw1407]